MPNTERNETVKQHIQRVLERAEPSLLPEELSQLADHVESSLASYASQLRRDRREGKADELLKEHRQKTLEISMAIALREVLDSVAKESSTIRAGKRLRDEIRKVLAAQDFGLTDDEKKRIEDRLIKLLDDYVLSPDEAKADLYDRGEQQVLSILDPPTRSKSASGNAR